MGTSKISQDIYVEVADKVTKKQDMQSVAKNILLIAIGAVLLFVSGFVGDQGSALYMLSVSAGVVVLVIGLLRFFMGKKQYILKQTGSKLSSYSIYFDKEESGKIKSLFETGRFDEIARLHHKDNGGVRVDMLVSNDKKFVAAQLFEYVPYRYEAVSPVICLYEEDAAGLSKCIE